MKNKKVILILVLILTIGFASVSTTLVLNGVIGISNKKDDFKVIFTNAKLDGVEKKEFIDSTTKQTLTYETNKLTTLNETTTLEYEVANTSRLYDASVSITCNIVDDAGNAITSEYVSMEYTPNNMIVEAGKTKTGSITTKLIKGSTEDKSIKVKCTLNASATERDSLGSEYLGPDYTITFNSNGENLIDSNLIVHYGKEYGELPTPTHNNANAIFLGWYTPTGEKVTSTSIVNLQEDHELKAGWYEITNDANRNGIADIGDEIKVGTESFYVISHTDTELNALAKYNLNVGEGKNPNVTEGIQHSTVRGWLSSGTMYGTVAFSNNGGWPSENNATINIREYDGPVKEALYGTNGYEKYIKETMPPAQVRLITKAELESLGCSASNSTCKGAPSWVYSTTYWTGSAHYYYTDSVWREGSDGDFDFGYFTSGCGVRPVITIPKN